MVFIGTKTPLDDRYAKRLRQELLNLEMVLESYKSNGVNRLLDRSGTDRYYDAELVIRNGVRYVKLSIESHTEPPTKRQIRTLVELCYDFLSKESDSLIVVRMVSIELASGFACFWLRNSISPLRPLWSSSMSADRRASTRTTFENCSDAMVT